MISGIGVYYPMERNSKNRNVPDIEVNPYIIGLTDKEN